ncbi:unnamed protein product [Darwinula stevensoni]|uniref:DNA (cytosine-5-)-methyltransferase n=1 Tax=Darwinula stevensoni TaxID=69355 RepID=A0A7R8XJI2_9CRUS|nr:unnamed protein product [Darwinula stevensoni]CAG0894250.1 unnamed protein product [Darwinula stevensoni]
MGYEKVKRGELRMQDICLACESISECIPDSHPFFHAGLCMDCRDDLRETIFSFDNSGIHEEAFLTEKPQSCVMHLPVPPVPVGNRHALRVLSLFDGIATGLFVLNKLGLDVEVYYASEVDEGAMAAAHMNFGDSIVDVGDVKDLIGPKLEDLGRIDLLIGGSPCTELSLVNPARKGLYDPTGTGILFFDFYRILQELLKRRNSEGHVEEQFLFWLFENVACMPKETIATISRFLGGEPAMLDARSFSPMRRPRLFWGNIPGLHSGADDIAAEQHSLQEKLLPHLKRKAIVKKIRTVTTNRNSLTQGKRGGAAVDMDGSPDTLWTTELEPVFGFPRHYTDTGNLSNQQRQKLLGRAWSVPVVEHIFRPLTKYFKSKEG